VKRVDIIGAGISGLATAYTLARSGTAAEIHVWDKSPGPGGLAGTFTVDDLTIEKFYHHLFKRDTALQELMAELGLAGQLQWRPAATGAYYSRRPYRFSTPLDLLRFDPLPFGDRIRLGLMALRARRVKNWEALDDMSAKDYIIREAGRRAYEVVWEPLLRGKFGPLAESVSAAWLWRKLVDRGGSRDSKGQEVLGYLRGGLGLVFDALVDRIRAAGHHVHLGTAVEALKATSSRIERIVTAAGTFQTDVVVAAAQTPEIAALLPPAAADYAAQLRRIEFLANVCLILVMRQPLSDFYWTNVTDRSLPFVGVVEQTRWADREDYGGHHVAYISAYVSADDPRLGFDAEHLFAEYLPHLQRLFPTFDPAVVEKVVSWRARYAQPVVSVGYRHLVPSVRSPIPNLIVCTMAQIYPSDRQVSNGVEMARIAAAAVNEVMA
jgi:protoporphyrinogen oxidase